MLGAITYVGFDSLPEAYLRLFGDPANDSFFLTLPWFRNLASTAVGQNEVAQIIGVEQTGNGNRPVGALVLKAMRAPKRLLSGVTLGSLTNYYSSYFAPVIARDYDQVDEIATAFARELQRCGHWDSLDIRPVDLTQTSIKSLYEALTRHGIQAVTYFCFGNWYLDVAGRSYAEYFRALPSIVKKNIPYYKRRIEKTARISIRLQSDFDGLESAIRDYELVYNSSWRDREEYPEFVRGLIRTAAAEGWLRLAIFYVDEEPAAAQLWIVKGRVASIYKVCYAEKFAKSSVGSILTAYMLEHVIDVERVREVDYLSGDDSYKANWMSHRRERWGIMAFNPRTLWGNLERVRHIGGRRMRPLYDRATAAFRLFQGRSAATTTR